MSETYQEQADRLAALEEGEFRKCVETEWIQSRGLFQCRFGGGCLTQARLGVQMHVDGWPGHLLDELDADQRIPVIPEHITRESLPAFVEWNERLDAEGVA